MGVKMSPDRNEKMIRRKDRSKRTDGAAALVLKLPLWKCLLFASVTVAAFFVLVEIVLAILGVRPILYNKDPYVGFSSTIPLFVEQQDPDGHPIMVTAENKLGLFNFQQFPARKSSDTYRIFCMGGSTTFGRPYDDATSFCGWLRALLPKADPSRSWEVINAGGVSYASYRMAALMEELIRYRPDLFIIYSGHNEFLERRTYSQIIEMPKVVRGLGALASRTRIYTVMEKAVDRLRKHPADSDGQRAHLPAEVQTVLADSVGPEDYFRDDELHQRVLDHYRYNLIRAVNIARSAGAEVILVTPASNSRDCSPFKSEHRESLSDTDRHRWQTLHKRANEAYSSNQWDQALTVLDEAITIDNRYAQTHYLRGRTLWKLERYDEAKTAFMQAMDEDICPLRATKAMIEIVKEVSREKKVPMVDFVGLLERLSEHATPGEALFFDHVHPTIKTNRWLALLLLETMNEQGIVHFSKAWDEAQIQQVTKEIEDRLDEKAHGCALRNLARVFRWAGKFEEGHKLSLRAVKMISEDAEVHALIGATAVELGRIDEAIGAFRQALQIKPDYAEARSSLADALAGQDRLDEAIKHYHRAIQDKPDHATTYCNLGVAMSAKGDLNEAVTYMSRALEIKPDFAEAHNSLGGVLVAQGKLDEAIKHYEAALQIKPHYIHARYNLASVLGWQGKFDEAIGQFERALQTQSDYVEAYCGLGLTFLSQGKSDEAVRSFYRALQVKPDCIEAHSSLGDILSDLKELDEAIDHYHQALSADPQNAHVHCNLGVALVRQGKLNEAVDHFRRAVQIKPDHTEAYNNLGSLLAATGRLDEAIRYLRQALQSKSGSSPHLQTGNGRTIHYYRQNLQSKADYARVHYNLGGMLVRTGDLSGALDNFQEALRLKPNWPEPYSDAAEILATHPDPKIRDLDQAIRFVERAAQLTGYQDISVLEVLAMCYAAAGRFDQATGTIESAIALVSAESDEDRIVTLRKKLELYKQKNIKAGS
ncbi:MAG: tetratricopeptide repeat protein [Sedimentisphaerales bacterium]|nr:tetratricopeptide repeat protein [Sedimentisphaerales bacterium]